MDSQDTLDNYEIYEIQKDLKSWEVAEQFNFDYSPIHPAHISNSLQMTMIANQGIALCAPQVGIGLRVIYIRGIDSALFNPKIVQTGDYEEYGDEISLSYPDMIVKIKRPDVIRVRFTDVYGNTQTQTFKGLTSRAIQRKIDFLDGQLFYKKATKYHQDQAQKKKKRAQ